MLPGCGKPPANQRVKTSEVYSSNLHGPKLEVRRLVSNLRLGTRIQILRSAPQNGLLRKRTRFWCSHSTAYITLSQLDLRRCDIFHCTEATENTVILSPRSQVGLPAAAHPAGAGLVLTSPDCVGRACGLKSTGDVSVQVAMGRSGIRSVVLIMSRAGYARQHEVQA